MATYTPQFEDALARVADLSAQEQDALAALLLAEIADGEAWDRQFADPRSAGVLQRLAAAALAEDAAGLTEPLDDLLA